MIEKITNVALIALAMWASYAWGRNAGLQAAIDIIEASISADQEAEKGATP